MTIKYRLFLCAVVALSSVCCCEKPENKTDNTPTTPTEITCSPESYTANKDGASFNLTVTSPSRPSVSGTATWVKIPDGTYNKETYKMLYNVTVEKNSTTQERSAVLTFTAGSLTREFTVTQPGQEQSQDDDAPKEMTLDKHIATIRQTGGTAAVIVTSPVEASVSGVPSWLTMTQTEFKNYKMKFTFKAEVNDSYDERSVELTVTAGSFTDKFIVAQEAKFKDPGALDNTAWKRGMELGLGWNMGNQLDAFANGVANETCWGNPACTQATFNGVKAAGFTSVRIPVTWQGHIGEAPDYKIDDAWMNRIYEVVGYAKKAGLKVILNTHHDEDHGDGHWQNLKGAVDSESVNTQVKEEIAAVWKQIAQKFKEEGDYLMFESFNELIYGTDWTVGSNPYRKVKVINEWNQVFVTAVRETGGNNLSRWLGVPGYAASPSYLTYLEVPQDQSNKTMLAFHCYDPYDYTIGSKQYSDWGHTGVTGLKPSDGESQIQRLFKGIYENYIAKDVPIYMGEFGCSMRDKNNERAWAFYLYYLEYVVKAARTYGIAAFLWDNGGTDSAGAEHHCYINHGTGQYMSSGEVPVQTMVKAWFTEDNDYTLQTVYDNAPSFN